MTKAQLAGQIFRKKSFLCIGLDSDISRLPPHLLQYDDPVFEFNRQIIEATSDLCVAYKPNLAFYESRGAAGWRSLEKTMALVPGGIFKIADAKRGDTGNTSRLYATAFFETMNFDAVTVAPYMGIDSVQPFLAFENKWVILLALTSNTGSRDFQFAPQEEGQPLFEKVMRKALEWGTPENLMFVTGATHPGKFEEIRRIAPGSFLLVPGIGAQGGDFEGVCKHGLTADCSLLINSSRGIIFAGNGENFAEKARAAALKIQRQMAQVLDKLQR
jgi:orotidine-5'-phosphate decarboxylase